MSPGPPSFGPGELSKVKAAKESLTIERDNISKEKEAISGELLMLQKQKSELDETAGNSAKFAEEKKALSDKCNKLEMEAFVLPNQVGPICKAANCQCVAGNR